MDSCDVLIVGGGPAGSSCAWGLRNSGLDVVVLDKQVFPRDKICGGWITPEVLEALQIDHGEYARGRALQPITGFRVGGIGTSAVDVHYEEPVSFGIRRREFDDYLLRRSGAKLHLGSALASMNRAPDGWVVNDAIRARVVVGAGGHFCPVARFLGAKTGGEPAVVAQETEFEMDARQLDSCQIAQHVPELYFCSDLRGYGWCFRKGNFLNIGLGRADSHSLGSHVKEFLAFLKSAGRIGFDVPPLRGHAYLLQGTSARIVTDDNVLLIGDSAGLAYPLSGEGIRPAVESGLRAAASIVAAHGTYTRERFDGYRMDIAAAPLSALDRAARKLPLPVLTLLVRQFFRTRWLVRRTVVEKWFLRRDG